MSTLAFILGVLFMATGVAASIALHEVGHLVPAKRFGYILQVAKERY